MVFNATGCLIFFTVSMQIMTCVFVYTSILRHVAGTSPPWIHSAPNLHWRCSGHADRKLVHTGAGAAGIAYGTTAFIIKLILCIFHTHIFYVSSLFGCDALMLLSDYNANIWQLQRWTRICGESCWRAMLLHLGSSAWRHGSRVSLSSTGEGSTCEKHRMKIFSWFFSIHSHTF